MYLKFLNKISLTKNKYFKIFKVFIKKQGKISLRLEESLDEM